ncbi:MAG: glycosyltransferase family 4 protein [Patescibacteria group bacterium]
MLKTLLATIDFPPQFGGVANYWANLIRFLDKERIVVLAPEYDNSLDFDIEQNYLVCRQNLISKKTWLWPKWLPLLLEMYRVVRSEKIQKIIVTQVLPVGTAAYLINKALGVPYVVSLHGLELALSKQDRWKHWLVKKILQSAEHLIVNSEFTRNLLINFDERVLNKTIVVYPCPNVNFEICAEEKIKTFLEKNNLVNKKIILTIGRLIERKGQDMVIDAMLKILEKVPDAVYLIVGQGERLNFLREKVKALGLVNNVKFFVDTLDSELPMFYHLSKLFIMPCRELVNGDVEGFGIVFLEANVYGKPVIAGKSGGAIEAVEHEVSGLLVDPKNIDKIAQAMILLLENEDYANKLGEAGRRRVEEKFNWQTQAKKLNQILSE